MAPDQIDISTRIFWLRMAMNELLRNGKTDYKFSTMLSLLFCGRYPGIRRWQ